MAKPPKKSRDEETAVCVLEWESTLPSSPPEGPQVLLIKRPEKGLLAGLFEFPSEDLPSNSPSTTKSRLALLRALLSTLLVEPVNPLVQSTTELGSITQVYSHQKRTYHIHRVVLRSETLPLLKEAKGKDRDGDADEGLGRSRPGRGKWVAEEEVQESNIGGAVVKVWERRCVGFVPEGKAKAKARTKVEEGEKVGAKETKPKAKKGLDKVAKVKEADTTASPKKKRKIRIVVTSDEEEE